ncbi:MAG: endonuclease [bacterium]
MRRFLIFICLSAFPLIAHSETLFPGVMGEALIDSLQAHFTPDPAIDVLNYSTCRDTLYAVIDNHSKTVEDVYSGYQAVFDPEWMYDPDKLYDPTEYLFSDSIKINAEHTWPKSLFDGNEPLFSDMHHIFPCWERVNGDRANLPFEYVDHPTKWYYDKNVYTSQPDSADLPLYSRGNSTMFEVRDVQKGNTARAVFYMWAIYQNSVAMQYNHAAENQSFFDTMKDDLLQWHRGDPPDSLEIARSEMIAYYQGNQNPFVLDSSLVARAFFNVVHTPDSPLSSALPERFGITSVYPNPFNPSTTVVLSVPETMAVQATVFNMLGQRVATLADGTFPAGYHTLVLDGTNIASGLYLLRVSSSNGLEAVRRITLVR